MTVVAIDLETSSAADLREVGAWAYSLHPSTVVWCVVFGYDKPNGVREFCEWEPGDDVPAWVRRHLDGGGRLLAHNAKFERAIWRHVLVPQYGFPPAEYERWDDTALLAAAANLPTQLDGLARVLGCPTQKDLEGAELMRRMSVQTSTGDGWSCPENTPANRARLREYCAKDVGATLDCAARLPRLTVAEERILRVDAAVNARGMLLDREFAANCLAMVERRKATLDDEAFGLTAGELANSTAAPALKAWLGRNGVALPKVMRKRANGETTSSSSVDRKTVLGLLEDPGLAAEVRAVLENRREASRTASLAKLRRVAAMVGKDGRLRDSLEYHGASTGRWTSRGLQVHNLPKDRRSFGERSLAELAIRRRDLELLEFAEDRPLDSLSASLRSIIAAPPGFDIVGGDFSAVEARVVAWLAGQDDVLDLFRRGEDVYVHAAASIGSDDRQLGKVCTLALGYGMGALKFVETAAAWGAAVDPAKANGILHAWRASNSAIVASWGAAEDAARAAIAERGRTFPAGRIGFVASKDCLRMFLPSGRCLRYWRPGVERRVRTIRVLDDDGTVKEVEMDSDEIWFFGVASNRRNMRAESTYGGKLVENATQAVARDLLAEALVRLDDAADYRVVVHVHDSIAAEVAEGVGSVEEFCGIMARRPAWAQRLPIAVDGYRDGRFRG